MLGSRPIFTNSHFDKYNKFKSIPDKNGPVHHAGRPVNIKPVWIDDYGSARIGRTGDLITMLDDLGISDRAF